MALNKISIAGRMAFKQENLSEQEVVFYIEQDRSAVFPCLARGSESRFISRYIHHGDNIICSGRLQSGSEGIVILVEKAYLCAGENGAEPPVST